jgi:tetratricopeptide (TPR) repeat protein
MTARAASVPLLSLALAFPCAAWPDAQSERAADWQSHFYPGVEALEARDLPKAEALLEQALLEIQPQGMTGAVASTYSRLCTVYELEGKLEKARALCTNAVAVSQRLKGNLHPEVAMAFFHLAQVESKLQEYGQALEGLTHAIDIMRNTGNGLKSPTKMFLEEFADNLEKKGDKETAARIRKRILGVAWEE